MKLVCIIRLLVTGFIFAIPVYSIRADDQENTAESYYQKARAAYEQETGNSNLGGFDYHPNDDNLSSGKAVGAASGGCRRTTRDFRRDQLDAWLRHYCSGL